MNLSLSRPDVWAGLVSASVLIPTAIAYATIAGLSAEAGLVAAVVGGLVYTLIGKSPGAIVAGTSSSAAVIASVAEAYPTLSVDMRSVTLFLTIMTGLAFMSMYLLKLGRLSHFIAKPVLRGYTIGLSLLIILSQAPFLFGMEHGNLGSPLISLWRILSGFFVWHFPTLLLSLFAGGMLIWNKVKNKHYPMPFIILILGILINIGSDAYGYRLADIGTISLVRSEFHILGFTAIPIESLAMYSILVFGVLYAESSTSIAMVADINHRQADENRELLAFGVSNLVSAIAGGMPVGAGFSQSAANISAGAKTLWASRVASLTLLGTVLFLHQFMAYIPLNIIGIIVVFSVSGPLNGHTISMYFRWRRDRVLVIVSILGVLFAGVADGLIFAVIISILTLLIHLSEPRLARLGQWGDSHDFVSIKRISAAKEIEGILIVRPNEPLFFANATPIFSRIRELIKERAAEGIVTHMVLISMEETPYLDGTSIEVIQNFADEVQSTGIQVQLCRVRNQVKKILLRANNRNLNMRQISTRSIAWNVEQAQ